MEKKYTVLIHPGGGYFLNPVEVLADSEEDALEKAVHRCLVEDIGMDFLENKPSEIKKVTDYFKKERKKYEDDFEFLTEHLNYRYMENDNIYVRMTETRIKKGWNLYDNSNPLPIALWDHIQKNWESMSKEELMKYSLEALYQLKENTSEKDWIDACQSIYEKVNTKE
jgi:hypothetical protein